MYKFTTFGGTERVRKEFLSAAEADEAMADRWSELVRPGDKVYHLGDVAFTEEGLKLVAKLPGSKRLILGNHDRFEMKHYRGVFKAIYSSRRFLSDMLLTHIPIHPESLPKGCWNLHGHIHERPSPVGNYFNLSVERLDYRPMDLDELRANLGLDKRPSL